MNKSINLEYIRSIVESENKILLQSFMKLSNPNLNHTKINNGCTEAELIQTIRLFEPIRKELTHTQKSGYYLGFIADRGIREEFDILRFSENSTLNIELKSSLPKGGLESVRDQLLRHKFYLGIMGKPVVCYAYIADTDTLYELNEIDEINLTDRTALLEIEKNYTACFDFKNLDFSQMVVSPYTDPVKFRDHAYFLTDEQQAISKKIINSNAKKIALTGGPGTGKSMIIFHSAKKIIDSGKTAAIIFCSKMGPAESNRISKILGIPLVPIYAIDNSLSKYDVVFLDEAQRIYESSLKKVVPLLANKSVFSLDHRQTLHPDEQLLNLQDKLLSRQDVEHLKLRDKIRTNPELSSFIQKMLNLKAKKIQPYNYSNVSIQHFNNESEAMNFVTGMTTEEGFVSIEFTEYITRMTETVKNKKKHKSSLSTHDVVGREYDKVLIILDRFFFYNDEGALSNSNPEYYPYLKRNMLFQSLTRVKTCLNIVVIDNPEIYSKLENIIHWQFNNKQ